MQELEISGIKITVVEKNIRNLYLRVYPPDGMVRMTVPRRTSEKVMLAFANSRLTWIVERQQEMRKRALEKKDEAQHCRAGDVLCLFGHTYRLEIETVPGRGQVYERAGCIVLQAPQTADENKRRALLERYYRDRLAQQIQQYLPMREAEIGVTVSSWYLRNMSTRWGTCNVRTARVCLNLKLVHYSLECLDYVITHELCHLIEANHGARFYALMDRYFPVWRQVKQALNTALPTP